MYSVTPKQEVKPKYCINAIIHQPPIDTLIPISGNGLFVVWTVCIYHPSNIVNIGQHYITFGPTDICKIFEQRSLEDLMNINCQWDFIMGKGRTDKAEL